MVVKSLCPQRAIYPLKWSNSRNMIKPFIEKGTQRILIAEGWNKELEDLTIWR